MKRNFPKGLRSRRAGTLVREGSETIRVVCKPGTFFMGGRKVSHGLKSMACYFTPINSTSNTKVAFAGISGVGGFAP